MEINNKFKIVGDSCCDYTQTEKNKDNFISVPLTIDIDGYSIIDDEQFNQQDFLKRVDESPNCPKSACPSPDVYMNAYKGNEDVYVVTLSAELSGSYNSAVLAKNLYEEEIGEKNIHVFNSMSASCGQLLICRKIEELAASNIPFIKVVEIVEDYIASMHTFFVLESLESLRKNGRLSNVKAALVNALNIKPIMTAERGTIKQLSQARGINKALSKMVDYIAEESFGSENKSIAISHCNCYERAVLVKDLISRRINFKNISIIDTKGISSLYANAGGIIVTY